MAGLGSGSGETRSLISRLIEPGGSLNETVIIRVLFLLRVLWVSAVKGGFSGAAAILELLEDSLSGILGYQN